MNEEMVLGQEPGEEHPVPVLVGAFVDEAAGGLRSGLRIALVAKLPSVGAQPIAKLPLVNAEMPARLRVADRQPLQRGPGRSLRLPPCGFDGVLQAVA